MFTLWIDLAILAMLVLDTFLLTKARRHLKSAFDAQNKINDLVSHRLQKLEAAAAPWPSYCACGAELRGGATIHAESCWIPKMLKEAAATLRVAE